MYSSNTPNLPTVSCIMPTYNRRVFVPQAIHYFLRQDYADKELIVVDDGSDPVADLIPENPHIRYIRLHARKSVGVKRNIACEAALGKLIAHWDDDDWHAPRRLSYQVEALLNSCREICGLTTLLFYEPATGNAWEYRYSGERGHWLGGSTLVYRRDFWATHRFPDADVGEDARFVWSAHPHELIVLADHSFHVGIIHPHNVSPKNRSGTYWHSHPAGDIGGLMAEDWAFYHPNVSSQSAPITDYRKADSSNEAKVQDIMQNSLPQTAPTMMTVAKASDLLLREYAAFNYGQSLPIMRRWEIPFVLFGARLGNTMSVLDCTINSANFEHHLKRLYAHTYYRQWNPIQRDGFSLPRGIPDCSFDRVICINTLEHLLRSQREALIADMARKLKPGGLLILTSDYYFDSAWSNPNFLNMGVMQADRSEVFNGWNKVTMAEWLELCKAHGMQPLSDPPPDPVEGDQTLYMNQAPYQHACIGGIFYKTSPPPAEAGKRVVLALLTWNTCAISIDSVRAHIAEARMLQRLGQQPMICVVDNGSNDGTQDALRTLEAQMDDIPHRFIYNAHNLGNSIARNQIIDAAIEWKSDYVLFVDGDIEIVPFSSFAMLRYMENQGHRVGCIGAHSRWQTPDRRRVSPSWYSIEEPSVQTTQLVAWTQYGMFRCSIFEDGVRFETRTPFDRPGWGFEDNDLAFQMEEKGYLTCFFSGMTYLHRALHSSIGLLRKNGYDPVAISARRQEFVVNKWASVPQINNGPLLELRRIVVNKL